MAHQLKKLSKLDDRPPASAAADRAVVVKFPKCPTVGQSPRCIVIKSSLHFAHIDDHGVDQMTRRAACSCGQLHLSIEGEPCASLCATAWSASVVLVPRLAIRHASAATGHLRRSGDGMDADSRKRQRSDLSSAAHPPFRAVHVAEAVRATRLSCQNAGKAQTRL